MTDLSEGGSEHPHEEYWFLTSNPPVGGFVSIPQMSEKGWISVKDFDVLMINLQSVVSLTLIWGVIQEKVPGLLLLWWLSQPW